jgi:hypothetical protein
MTPFPNPTPLAVPDHSSESKTLFLSFFLSASLVLLLLGAAQIIRHHEVSKGIALGGAGFLALLSSAVLLFWGHFRAPGVRLRITRWTLAVTTLSWCAWTGLIAYTHHINGWDEGAYLLSGMALRGYDVPYASHRPPVTGFLCAAFIGGDRLLNPVLLCLLLISLYLWMRRLLGVFPAALCLFVLLCQNLFLEGTVDIMSELPAALLLLVGFSSLAQERFWWSAVWFALVVFTRWNLAPVWAVVFMAVLIRFGTREALKFLAAGLTVFCAWYALTVAMGASNPLLSVYKGNFLPGLAWAGTPDQKPDFLLRIEFYAKHFFFLTPPVLFMLMANAVLNLRKKLRSNLWIALIVIPIALLVYIFTILFIGGLFPRFITPLIPSALVSVFTGLFMFGDGSSFPEPSRVGIVTLALFLACAVGLWPLYALVQARLNHNTQTVFSVDLRRDLIALGRKVSLNAVPREPLSGANGHPAMVEARHRIDFPSAHRDFTYNIIDESDSVESVLRLAAACRSGDLLIIPKKYASAFQPAAVLFSDEEWAIVRNP